MKNIVILGATSEIGKQAAICFCKDPSAFILVGRKQEKLASISDELRHSGAKDVRTIVCDLTSTKEHRKLLESILTTYDTIDVVLICHGILGDQKTLMSDYDTCEELFQTNFMSILSFVNLLTAAYVPQRSCVVGIISSVAGVRGRAENFLYGASKAALTTYADGLRASLQGSKFHVVTILPGLTTTPMTGHMPKNILFSSAEKVGKDIYDAVIHKKNKVFTPFWWRYIMFVVWMLPERLVLNLTRLRSKKP
ncbi:MAG: SDR family NAD(P)-dependent oxidoreductase [Oligoflexales bacterium]